jgi:hypothetical protein
MNFDMVPCGHMQNHETFRVYVQVRSGTLFERRLFCSLYTAKRVYYEMKARAIYFDKGWVDLCKAGKTTTILKDDGGKLTARKGRK